MYLHKLKLAPVALAAVASAALAAGLFAAAAADPPAPPARVALVEADPPAPKAAPLPKGPDRIVFYHDGRLTLIDPNGKNAVSITAAEGKHHPLPSPLLSPDGSRVAYLVQTRDTPTTKPGEAPPPAADPEYRLYVRKTTGNDPPTDLGVHARTFAWSGDGTRIAVTNFVAAGDKLKGVHKVVAVATKAVEALPLPDDHVLTDWSRDGRYFVTQQAVLPKEKGAMPVFRLRLLNRDGSEHKVANAPTDILMNGRLSPDGKRLLCEQYLILNADGKRVIRLPVVLDLSTGAVAPLNGFSPNAELQGYCWSPDGKRVAYAWREKQPREAAPVPTTDIESFLVVCDADGLNAKTVARATGDRPGLVTLAGPDWR
jgi:Tol biopolymer transport system component